MSQKLNRLSVRIFCSYLAITCIVSHSSLIAQVPTNIPLQNNNLALTEKPLETSNTVVKVITAGNAIPFGISPNRNSMAVLDMKGYDQEFVRSFTFKNTSAVSYSINSVDFERKDNNFDIFSLDGKTLPMEVAPGETFTVHVAFHAFGRNELRTNELHFSTDQNKEPVSFFIQAMQQPLSAMPWNNRVQASLPPIQN